LELETDNKQLNAQYKLLNEKSGKILKQDEDLRKLEHEVTDFKGRKKELELQVSKL
jgi:predicted  nucleic acid-binding Zn-ribbon protein